VSERERERERRGWREEGGDTYDRSKETAGDRYDRSKYSGASRHHMIERNDMTLN